MCMCVWGGGGEGLHASRASAADLSASNRNLQPPYMHGGSASAVPGEERQIQLGAAIQADAASALVNRLLLQVCH